MSESQRAEGNTAYKGYHSFPIYFGLNPVRCVANDAAKYTPRGMLVYVTASVTDVARQLYDRQLL